MDFPFLAKIVKLNTAALAAIASAPPPPEPTVEGTVSPDTKLNWEAVPVFLASYVVYTRRTDAAIWENQTPVSFEKNCATQSLYRMTGKDIVLMPCHLVLPHIRVDDWVFGVSSVSADGFESPVASAVPGGAFKPYVVPPAK